MSRLEHLITLSFLITASFSCKTIQVYDSHDSPKIFQNSFNHSSGVSNEIIVTSFNIKTGTQLERLLTVFDSMDKRIDFDILLLQEVNDIQVKAISEMYLLNYVYYPISISDGGINFGNAVLSKFNMSKESKLILPHKKINGRIRNATNCVLSIDGKEILIYSIHNETFVMRKKKRDEQLGYLLIDIEHRKSEYDGIIVGGDFNTICKKRITKISKKFSKLGFEWSSVRIGPTASQLWGILNMPLDHFFIKNLEITNIQKMQDIRLGDHLPISICIKSESRK